MVCKAFADERKAGRLEARIEILSNYMKNKNVSLETAMKDHGIPLEEKKNISDILQHKLFSTIKKINILIKF